MNRDSKAKEILDEVFADDFYKHSAHYGFRKGWDALRNDVREVVKSLRVAAGRSEDERWTERASAYKQAAEWLEEIVGK